MSDPEKQAASVILDPLTVKVSLLNLNPENHLEYYQAGKRSVRSTLPCYQDQDCVMCNVEDNRVHLKG